MKVNEATKIQEINKSEIQISKPNKLFEVMAETADYA
jgi:hypothetical protein